jgi:hypothetical protein
MTDREAILDKIRKLLRMKRGGTPDEVATASRQLTGVKANERIAS